MGMMACRSREQCSGTKMHYFCAYHQEKAQAAGHETVAWKPARAPVRQIAADHLRLGLGGGV